MNATAPAAGSIWRQPMTVWAVAFACVVSFMGIGLVDPILPAIASELHASEVETELLFTSYLLLTGVAMLFTSWVSSRIGTKATLLIGLAVIVVFSLLCAVAGGVDWVIGFRAGWGLGNALFISTALAAIVGAASGGPGAAIVLYEAALGLGIAVGPLLGGLLGEVSWRGPFFGVAILMAVGFIAIVVLLRKEPATRAPVRLSAPFVALGTVPSIRTLAIAALLYNYAFFTLLAYTPFPLGFGAIGLGFTFFGWGVALAITSIWVAPWLTRRFRRTSIVTWSFTGFALLLVVTSLLTWSPAALVVLIVLAGLLQGVLNTVVTEAVMEASDLPRTVASSAYSSVRFVGGAVAAPLAAYLAHVAGTWLPYVVAAVAVGAAAVVIAASRGRLARIDGARPDVAAEAEAIGIGDVD
ncbi:MAG: MFS transporter [Micrococcales bacterium 73-13]|nr:MAG: MFS transporter [Micrococcales bacterium 73-13]